MFDGRILESKLQFEINLKVLIILVSIYTNKLFTYPRKWFAMEIDKKLLSDRTTTEPSVGGRAASILLCTLDKTNKPRRNSLQVFQTTKTMCGMFLDYSLSTILSWKFFPMVGKSIRSNNRTLYFHSYEPKSLDNLRHSLILFYLWEQNLVAFSTKDYPLK